MPPEMAAMLLISIHAPREGGDTVIWLVVLAVTYFNPRPPRGGRHCAVEMHSTAPRFQSTPPARGATYLSDTYNASTGISIHAPREGGDIGTMAFIAGAKPFQSTPPARGATTYYPSALAKRPISIHAPREGGDVAPSLHCHFQPSISIHAPREGGDHTPK